MLKRVANLFAKQHTNWPWPSKSSQLVCDKQPLDLEFLESRILLNVGHLGLMPLQLEIVDQSVTVSPDTIYSFDVRLNAESFEFDGTVDEFTLDFSDSNNSLRIHDWNLDSAFDLEFDITLDSDSNDNTVRVGSSSGVSGNPFESIILGTWFVTTPSTAGSYSLSIGGPQTTFTTNFGITTGLTFDDLNLVVSPLVEEEDFGDAPDTFGTTLLNFGPSHTIIPGNFLGASIDGENDGQPNFNANGDDNDADGDDEDGVIFNSTLRAGLLAEMTVTASQAGLLDAWIDYNGNGVFDLVPTAAPGAPGPIPPDEYVPNAIIGHAGGGAPYPLVVGANVINFFVPNSIDADISYARFRFSTAGGLLPTGGPAVNGEVEDYQVQLFPLTPDFGDAPAPYPTLLADDGALHVSSIADFYLGEKIDYESDGIPDANALGDDEDDGLDFPVSDDADEDGVTLAAFMIPGETAQISVFATVPSVIELGVGAWLDAWIDWNGDGDWDDAGEQVFTNEIIFDGDNNLQVPVPANAVLGQTYGRFRLSSEGSLQPTGPSESGEVEDWVTTIATGLDYDIANEEQLFVYLLNRARSNPQAYEVEQELSVSLAGIDSQPPLAVNPFLTSSASFHSEEMATNDYFGHQSQVTGDWPNKMARDAGYNLPFGDNSNQIESIGAGFGKPPVGVSPTDSAKALQLLIEDLGVVPPAHRQHLLAMSGFWEQHREIGVGFANNNIATLRNYWTIHTAYVNAEDLFLTGVAFNDANNNGVYDLNEGLGGVSVSSDQGGATLTNSAGGWSMAVSAGTHIVTTSGGNFSGAGSSAVIVTDSNVEVDFISGQAAGVVDFGQDTGSGLPKVSVTATDADAAEGSGDPGVFTISRTGDKDDPVTVNYTITGTATDGTDFGSLAGSVVIGAGESSATVTVSPVDDEDIEGQETVVLSIQASGEFEFGVESSATVTIADDEGVLVTLGGDQPATVTYTEADGTVGSATVKSGEATVVLVGDNLAVQTGSKSVQVSGPGGASLSSITLDNTNLGTSLSFKASGGDGFLNVEDIQINGSAKDIKGKQVHLMGDLVVTGYLAKLELADVADQHLISVGPPATATATLIAKFRNVSDLGLSSMTPIKSLSVVDWADGDAVLDVIGAPWIGKIAAKNNFAAGLLLTGNSDGNTLGGVKVGGTITGGTWVVIGSGGKIAANAIDPSWSATFFGDVTGISTKGNASGNLTANAVKSFAVKGDFTNAIVTLNQAPDAANPKLKALGKLSVKGTTDGVTIRALGGIGSFTTGLLFDSNIFAGVDNSVTGLPTAALDLVAEASIDKFSVKGDKTLSVWVRNSNIAADHLGKVGFGFAQTDNSDVSFGLAMVDFGTITYRSAVGTSKVSDPLDIGALAQDDLIVRLLA